LVEKINDLIKTIPNNEVCDSITGRKGSILDR
jgi:hypothetical protein